MLQKQAVRYLDERFSQLRPALPLLERPVRGWVRAIREALGMTAQQVAVRMGVSRERIVAIERDELKESLTLATLERAAEALGCRLVYALIPRETLQTSLESQAQKQAEVALSRTSHTMNLEAQPTTKAEKEVQLQRLTAELLDGNPARLWDDHYD